LVFVSNTCFAHSRCLIVGNATLKCDILLRANFESATLAFSVIRPDVSIARLL